MACCNCCTNTLNLGCFDSCGLTFDTAEIVGVLNVGDWVIEMQQGRRKIKFIQAFALADPVIFNLYNLNENFTYEDVIITDPTGSQFTYTFGGIVYDCFKFTTQYNSSNEIILS